MRESMTAALNNRTVEQSATAAPLSGFPQQPTRRLRLFHLSQRILARAHTLIEALNAGFWLGCLSHDQLKTLVFQHYDQAALYRTAEHNLYGLFPRETEFIRDHFNECHSVLVAAAGGGREMIALARAGVRVDGFECNPGLADKCQEFLVQAGVSGRVLRAAPDQIPSELQQYDGAIVGFGALAHILGRTTRINFLRDLKGHLHPHAPLLLSVGRRPQGSRYYGLIYQFARAIRLVRGSGEYLELGDDLLDCFTHRFVKDELSSELQEAGFKIVAYVETHEIVAVAQALNAD